MYSDAELQLSYKLGNAQLNKFPFPHFYLSDIFPENFYSELQSKLPDPDFMIPIEKARPVKGYKERFVLGFDDESLASLPTSKRDFWCDLRSWMLGGELISLILEKFNPFIKSRFEGKKIKFTDELLLVQDISKYKLGPHTDSPRKVVTMLFYLPSDSSQGHMGTSIYVPKDPNFKCSGGPHYPHSQFSKMCTMPFLPNTLFGFLKTNNSFHGVEPLIDPNIRRWLLLYDIYATKVE